ncbi:hypothetical protein EK904_014683 [Melospiza melodia maxima]|nr:hypothetical protein EK904_014683 [Melospiza melodia maxima]
MVVNYSCDPGYSLRGEASIHCTSSGNWSLPLPQCAGKQCRYPEPPRNGRVVVLTDLLFGSTVSHTCDEGYRLVGESHRRCEILGRDVAWTGLPPICKRVVCPAPRVQNGSVAVPRPRYTFGDSVTFKCHRGFTLRGHPTSQCQGDRRWHPPVPVCEQEIRCEFPDVQGVKKAIKGSTYRSGTNITLECDDGYVLEGISHTQCQEDFSWDPPVPACKLTSPKPGSVGLGVAAAAVLLLLGAGVVWKIISKQKEGYYHTYENYNYRTPLNPDTDHKGSCLP